MLKTPIFGYFGPKRPIFRWKRENVTFLLIFFIFQYNKRAVLGLSANFLNIVIIKNQFPERDFPSVKFFQLKTILNQSEEKSKNRII